MCAVMTSAYPSAPLRALDTLWLQVSGTLCNLACTHCFIACSPSNHTHEMMPLESVTRYLAEADALGVKECYVTGGEPFMHPRILDILEAALAIGPVSILTNGILIRPETAARLRRMSDASGHRLELRVSIDGYDDAANDAIRGEGTFRKILKGIRHLVEAGLPAVITVTGACEAAGTPEGEHRFAEFLAENGLPRLRLKVLPLLRLGAEPQRSRPYLRCETLAGRELSAAQTAALQCTSCRMATARGVWVCPILLDVPEARMGETLAETLRPFELKYPACHTCHATGLTCRT